MRKSIIVKVEDLQEFYKTSDYKNWEDLYDESEIIEGLTGFVEFYYSSFVTKFYYWFDELHLQEGLELNNHPNVFYNPKNKIILERLKDV